MVKQRKRTILLYITRDACLWVSELQPRGSRRALPILAKRRLEQLDAGDARLNPMELIIEIIVHMSITGRP